jgi:glucosamine--fructose-6-phosphate aminotransferase (isomerizing)
MCNMCGIFGYAASSRPVWTTVATALRTLEYRGYDSWGVAWVDGGEVEHRKNTGRIDPSTIVRGEATVAIGHTRWATHGGVTQANAHPHFGPAGKLALVHNGIVENLDQLREELGGSAAYASQTDTEVIAHLIEEALTRDVPLFDAVRTSFCRLEGCNAIVVMHPSSDELIVARHVSPVLVGIGESGTFVTSDVLAIAPYCDSMSVLPNQCIVRLSPTGIAAFDQHGVPIHLEFEPIPVVRSLWVAAEDSHHMDIEMRQQREVLRHLVGPGVPSFDRLVSALRDADEVVFTGCGSALFAARIAETYFRDIAGIRATAIPASELHHFLKFLTPDSLVIALSQSGETVDVIDAVNHVQEAGIPVSAIVNVMHSTLARMVDIAVPLGAGHEQCVLATKSWVAKVGVLLRAATAVVGAQDASIAECAEAIEHLLESPEVLGRILDIAERMAGASSALVVGSGLGAATAQEVALKIKESSYVHAEAFAAGELKHGAIALVEEGTPCLVLGSLDPAERGPDLTAQELLSRGGYTIGVGTGEGSAFCETIALPQLGWSTPIAQVVVAQMIAYRTALARHLDPDRPRNLAKSVTVK